MPAWFINSGTLYRQAKGAAVQASLAGPNAQSEARIAVVFAFIALEAFINELSDFANETPADASLATFGSLMKDLNDARAPLNVRFQFAKWILSKEAFDTSQQPYQDFLLLIRLRNTIIHLPPDKAPSDTSEPPIDSLKFLETLRQRGLTRGSRDAVASFLAEISTPEMARWACDTTAAIVRSIVEVLPALADVPDSPHVPIRFLFAKEFGL
jgi:hypothetical protein